MRTIFIYFSSAFNTTQPHLLIPKLLEIGFAKCPALWILDFLTNRQQFVSVKSGDHAIQSSTLINIQKHRSATGYRSRTNFLFYIYTKDCTSTCNNIIFIKHTGSDNTSIQSLIRSYEDQSCA